MLMFTRMLPLAKFGAPGSLGLSLVRLGIPKAVCKVVCVFPRKGTMFSSIFAKGAQE